MAEFTPVDMGVMRIPLSPLAMELSIAEIWPASSPSSLPEATVRLTLPALSANSFAPFCMATKNGFDESLVMSATPTLSPPPGAPPPLLPPQALSISAALARDATMGTQGVRGRTFLLMLTSW